jgi:pimeloyl-ACP methyl ester carboxylesterase
MDTTSSTAAAPAAAQVGAFYGGSRIARWMGRGMRAAHAVSPGLALRLAMRLFFTPVPLKLAARARPASAAWRPEPVAFERGRMVLWHREATDDAPAAARPKVLLVHGWAGDAMQLRLLGDALAADGFEPLLLDFPGHGRSDGWRSTLPQFVRALFAVQARIGPLHAVVAHSLGSLAMAHAAARGLAAERLVMVSPPIAPAVFIHGFAAAFGLGPGLARRMREAIQQREGVPLDQFEPGWLGPRVMQPTLVLHDRDDRAAPLSAAQQLTRALPRARLHITEGLGHRRILADSSVAAAVIAHLREPVASPQRIGDLAGNLIADDTSDTKTQPHRNASSL